MKIFDKTLLVLIYIIVFQLKIRNVSGVNLKNLQHTKLSLEKNVLSKSNAEVPLSKQFFLGHETRQNLMKKIPGSQAFSNIPVIVYYFASTTCPACIKFTPYLKSLYEDWNKFRKLVEIIWVQVGDCSQTQWEEFYSHMPWLAIPKNDPRVYQLEQKMKLQSVPELVIISNEGEILVREGYRDVVELGRSSIAKWLDKSLKSL